MTRLRFKKKKNEDKYKAAIVVAVTASLLLLTSTFNGFFDFTFLLFLKCVSGGYTFCHGKRNFLADVLVWETSGDFSF